jgi:hypothetical protein
MTLSDPSVAALFADMRDLIRFQREYIMALPADVVATLPTMPGFDGDWAAEVETLAARVEIP